jgi:hypothetical protein
MMGSEAAVGSEVVISPEVEVIGSSIGFSTKFRTTPIHHPG